MISVLFFRLTCPFHSILFPWDAFWCFWNDCCVKGKKRWTTERHIRCVCLPHVKKINYFNSGNQQISNNASFFRCCYSCRDCQSSIRVTTISGGGDKEKLRGADIGTNKCTFSSEGLCSPYWITKLFEAIEHSELRSSIVIWKYVFPKLPWGTLMREARTILEWWLGKYWQRLDPRWIILGELECMECNDVYEFTLNYKL